MHLPIDPDHYDISDQAHMCVVTIDLLYIESMAVTVNIDTNSYQL